MKDNNEIEVQLLRSLLENSYEDKNLYLNRLLVKEQLVEIEEFCNLLNMKLSEMIEIGRNHEIEDERNLAFKIISYYQTTLEQIVIKLFEKTSMKEEQIDLIVDTIYLNRDYGDYSYSARIKRHPFIKKELYSIFNIYDFLDIGTEIEFTENGEFGFIDGVRHDTANLSNEEINSILLSKLIEAKNTLVGEL